MAYFLVRLILNVFGDIVMDVVQFRHQRQQAVRRWTAAQPVRPLRPLSLRSSFEDGGTTVLSTTNCTGEKEPSKVRCQPETALSIY